jgi:AcrR family transcriptional regulator
MSQIAKRAKVGPGTPYRSYPTREPLVLAVDQNEINQLVGAVPELLAARPPMEALQAGRPTS